MDGGFSITANRTGEGKVFIFTSTDTVEHLLDTLLSIVVVTVYQEAASLEVSPDSVNLAAGDTATLSARIMDANGHDIQLADAAADRDGLVVSWATGDSETATVAAFGDSDGSTETGHSATVTAVAAGTATINGKLGQQPQ